jgi:hypothetical protein
MATAIRPLAWMTGWKFPSYTGLVACFASLWTCHSIY